MTRLYACARWAGACILRKDLIVVLVLMALETQFLNAEGQLVA